MLFCTIFLNRRLLRGAAYCIYNITVHTSYPWTMYASQDRKGVKPE